MTADRKAYSAAYYAANPDKWKRSQSDNLARNEARRKRYAADQEHREKIKRQVRDYRERQPLQRKAGMYGISKAQVEMMLDNGCQICHANPHVDSTVRMHIDHNHETGMVRGALCQPCNLALGFLRDDPIRVMAMYDYLMRVETSGSSGADSTTSKTL
jgi:hypothetical protein